MQRYLKIHLRAILLLGCLLFGTAADSQAATYSVVRSFGVLTNVSGFAPQAALVQDAAGAFYGTTSTSEGDYLTGTIFKIQANGAGFQVLKSFSAPVNFTNSNGANPYGGLALSGNTLYGTTYNGGTGGSGNIFSLQTDGTAFTVLTNFPPALLLTNSIGAHPYGGLIVSGGVLYGTTQEGGLNGNGTVFQLNTNGTGLAVLKTFSAIPFGGSMNSDGAMPDGTLVLAGGVLYGTTVNGGTSGNGTLFALNLATTNFTVYHQFTGGNDGASPHGGLALSGSWLFGTASGGGAGFSGTVFMINTSGSGFNTVYSFSGGDDGSTPYGGVVVSGSTIYGATYGTGLGGPANFGNVFSVNTNGSGFNNLYYFNGNTNGANPVAGLILSGSTLYGSTTGVTGQEDTAGGNGTIFAANTNGLAFTNLYTFGYSDGVEPYATLMAAGNAFYGTTYEGGSGGNGTVFRVNPDGSGYTLVKDFSAFGFDDANFVATNGDGANPQGSLAASGGALYGTTYYGGTNGYGTIFGVNTNGSNFASLYSFTGGNDGAYPQAGLVLSGSVLYGSTVFGGANDNGVVFAINTNGSGFQILHTFSATTSGTNFDGASPSAALIMSGNTLFGTALSGGVDGFGTVFSLNASTTNFSTIHSFTGGADGANPYASLLLSGGWLYGATYNGGTNNNGSVFMVATNTATFVTIKNFSALAQNSLGLPTNSDGANPYGGLVFHGNQLYGTTLQGGTNGYGTVFAVNTNGSPASFTNLYSLAFSGGASPYGGLAFSSNSVYGTALDGGAAGDGAVFALALFPQPIPLTIQPFGPNVVLTWTNSAFSLYSSPFVTGPWTKVNGATSPFLTNASGTRQFFELQAPQ